MTEPYLILGADPGNSGAWALLDPYQEMLVAIGNVHQLSDEPRRRGSARARLKGAGLKACLDRYGSLIRIAVVEQGSTRKQEGRWRVYRTGENVGEMRGILVGFGLPASAIKTVTASTWKPGLGLPPSSHYQERKRVARAFAQRLFPGIRFSRHDHADAALLALWYARCIMRGHRD